MATLYELVGVFADIYNMEIDEETKLDTLEAIDWEQDFENKVEGYVKVIRNLEADMAARKAERKRLSKLDKADANKIEYLKATLSLAMAQTGHERVDTTLFKVGFRKSEAVEVDESILDKEYMVATYKPDKKTLKALLKDGQIVPGAVLETRKNLSIR